MAAVAAKAIASLQNMRVSPVAGDVAVTSAAWVAGVPGKVQRRTRLSSPPLPEKALRPSPRLARRASWEETGHSEPVPGNAIFFDFAKSPPLYPVAYVGVISVSATDADDSLLTQSNRGDYITVAAPGAQILVATPFGYEVSSGTSYSAAEASSVAALLLQRDPRLTPAKVRHILQETAKDLGRKGRHDEFGAGLVDAFAALNAETVPAAGNARPAERVSTGGR